jgi:hypothetical protein
MNSIKKNIPFELLVVVGSQLALVARGVKEKAGREEAYSCSWSQSNRPV